MTFRKFGEGRITGVDQDDEQGIAVEGARGQWGPGDTRALAEENRRADGSADGGQKGAPQE